MKTGAFDDSLAAALGERLARRVHASVLAHRDYRTVRREDRLWVMRGEGRRACTLTANAQARVELWTLPPGTALPQPEDAAAQEILVIEGRLVGCDADGAVLIVPRHGLALRGGVDSGGSPWPALRADEAGATLYLRHMLVAIDRLPPTEAAWWALPRAPLQTVQPARRRWHETFPGVQVLPLWGMPECTSMLVRFAPGASVPDHHHEVDEDCLMLEGEMFLGDVLLRPGDYQLAPAGGGHFGECSDVGGLFFFHGAIDPVLDPQRPPIPTPEPRGTR